MTRSHHRSGALVSGHYRNGTWVEDHYRRGTTVSEFEHTALGWSIYNTGRLLSYTTKCWWCEERVFFHRDKNGGCVLFDALGPPWPVHSCWEDHSKRSVLTQIIQTELAQRGYRGVFYVTDAPTLRKPQENLTRVSLTGYIVDNQFLYPHPKSIFLRSSRRVCSLPLVRLEVFDGQYKYPFLIGAGKADIYPDYSFVEIEGRWFKKGNRWRLLTTLLRRVGPSKDNSRFRSVLQSQGECTLCGKKIRQNVSWGLDDRGFQECGDCGEMRGKNTRTQFLRQIRKIVKRC